MLKKIFPFCLNKFKIAFLTSIFLISTALPCLAQSNENQKTAESVMVIFVIIALAFIAVIIFTLYKSHHGEISIFNNYTDLLFTFFGILLPFLLIADVSILELQSPNETRPKTTQSASLLSLGADTAYADSSDDGSISLIAAEQPPRQSTSKHSLLLKIFMVIFTLFSLLSLIFSVKCSIAYNRSIIYIVLSIFTKMFLAYFIVLMALAPFIRNNDRTRSVTAAIGCLIVSISAIYAIFKYGIQRSKFVNLSDCWNGR
ncbi:MAG: hypothetical protein LBF22_01210 [Deltaproteobacteria bacterium]|jgi:hypothetical protein|nr:hypothetical protein [Deltaproteobacteria bacterium]